MRIKTAFSIMTFMAVLATPVAAQDDLSVEQLRQKLEAQRQVFKEATTNGLGKTRGLKLVTVDDAAPAAAGAEVKMTAKAEGNTGAAAPADGLTPVAADPNAPLIFGQLDPELQVNLHIEFGFDSAALAPSEAPKLVKMCEVLKGSTIEKVRIVGHTDASGSDDYNERLSVLRAQEVARSLINDCGIPEDHIETLGLGERFPFNADNPRADENRRVEFQALS